MVNSNMTSPGHQSSQPPESAADSPQTLGFWATFVYYFSSTTLIGALAAAQALHLGLSTGEPYRYGIGLGLLAGLVGAYYNRSVVLEINFTDRDAFLTQLNQTLTNLGFTPHEQLEDYQIYRRSGLSHFFTGSIMVKVADRQATLLSRAANIRRLKRLLP